MFSGKKIFPYLSWGLFVSLGLYESGTISTSALKLAQREGLLIPEPEYHNADPLPQDWINMLEEKPNKSKERSSTHEATVSEIANNRQNMSSMLTS